MHAAPRDQHEEPRLPAAAVLTGRWCLRRPMLLAMRKAALLVALVAVATSFAAAETSVSVERASVRAPHGEQSPDRISASGVRRRASVKTNRSGESGADMRLQPDGSLTASNVPLVDLLQVAYGYPAHRIDGLSGWVLTERFDIAARGTTAPGAPIAGGERIALSLRVLLAERFLLRAHAETGGRHPWISTAPRPRAWAARPAPDSSESRRLSRYVEWPKTSRATGAAERPPLWHRNKQRFHRSRRRYLEPTR